MDSSRKPQFVVTVLGSGTCVPSATRFPPAYFVKPATSSGGWLMDASAGALQRLAKENLDYKSVDCVFVSHDHRDHVAGLMPLLQALYVASKKGMVLKPLTIYGPESVKKYWECNLECVSSLRPSDGLPYSFHVLADGSEVSGNSWHLRTRAMLHSTPGSTLGFRFTQDNCTLVYGADTAPCDAIIDLSKGADLLILEASYPKGTARKDAKGHLTTYEAGAIALEAGAKRLLISHFYPEVGEEMDDEKRKSEVGDSGFDGEIISAADGMSLKVFRHL